jgi:hypothetical protein
MMHNPVAEVGCKYLPLYRFVYNKGNRSALLVCAIVEVLVPRVVVIVLGGTPIVVISKTTNDKS